MSLPGLLSGLLPAKDNQNEQAAYRDYVAMMKADGLKPVSYDEFCAMQSRNKTKAPATVGIRG